MSIRTDLAMENEKLILEKLPEGVTLEKEDVENTHIDVLKSIDEIGEKALSKSKGIYITAEISGGFKNYTVWKHKQASKI